MTPIECAEFPERTQAHNSVAFTETCECGAVRAGERGSGRVNLGEWVTAEQVQAVKETEQPLELESESEPAADTKKKKST